MGSPRPPRFILVSRTCRRARFEPRRRIHTFNIRSRLNNTPPPARGMSSAKYLTTRINRLPTEYSAPPVFSRFVSDTRAREIDVSHFPLLAPRSIRRLACYSDLKTAYIKFKPDGENIYIKVWREMRYSIGEYRRRKPACNSITGGSFSPRANKSRDTCDSIKTVVLRHAYKSTAGVN